MRCSVSGFAVIGLVAALALVLAAPSRAGMFGSGSKSSGSAAGPDHVDCDAVAAASGMDKATCESLNQAQASYYAAQHDPAGARPGDDEMTCDRIKAELTSQAVSAPPAEHAAEAQAAVTDFRTKQTALQAKTAADMIALNAAATAATAAGMANPIAGKAADMAVEAAREATEKSLNAEAKATVTPAERKMLASTVTVMGDMVPQVTNNPRLAHLIQLSAEKHCHGF